MSYRGGFGGGRSCEEDCSTMMVESFRVGKIIGKGGSKIKELEQDANVRIKVAKEEDDQGRKSVEISGAPEDIKAAMAKIEECLCSNDYGGGRRGGYGGGRGGFGQRNDNWGHRDGGDGYRRGGGRGGFGGRGGNRDDHCGGDRETVYVETGDVGRIIGKGGSRIREFETDSGCSIKVSKEPDSYGRNTVDLTGSQDSISKAINLIEEAGVVIMKEENDRDRGW